MIVREVQILGRILIVTFFSLSCTSLYAQKIDAIGSFDEPKLIIKAKSTSQSDLILRFDVASTKNWAFISVATSEDTKVESIVCVVAIAREGIDLRNERFAYEYSFNESNPIEIRLAMFFGKDGRSVNVAIQAGIGASSLAHVLCSTRDTLQLDLVDGRLLLVDSMRGDIRQLPTDWLTSPLRRVDAAVVQRLQEVLESHRSGRK